MLNKFTLFFILSGILLLSCNKDPLFVPSPRTDAPLLKIYALLDTSRPSGADTVLAKYIAYDSVNRTSTIVTKNLFPGREKYMIETRKYFSGYSFKVAARFLKYYNAGFNTITDSAFQYFSYDYLYRPVYDSIRFTYLLDSTNARVYLYRYEANLSHVILHYYRKRDTIKYVGAENQIIQDNIVASSMRFRDSVTTNITASMVYDNQPNPLYYFSLQFPVIVASDYIADFGFLQENEKMQGSNFISGSYLVNGSTINLPSVTYEYNDRGYPVTARFRDEKELYTAGKKVLKAVYVYF